MGPSSYNGDVASLVEQLERVATGVLVDQIGNRVDGAAPDIDQVDPVVRPSDFADVQVNGALALAKRLGENPRELGAAIETGLANVEFVAKAEVSGPGFVNISFTDESLMNQVNRRLQSSRLGVPVKSNDTVVIDYSQPNIAKEMHVGHIRSTVIGDALARVLGFLGSNVIRHNHLGDWGTQFGMLLQYLDDESVEIPQSAHELNELYRASRARFDDDESFKARARGRVSVLQSGDEKSLQMWREIVAVSARYFEEIYERLDVLLTPQDNVGESFYNPMLDGVVAELLERGIAVEDAGALVVFSEIEKTAENKPLPLIVRKSDGGYGYGTTDLAAVLYRARTLHADRILYVVDARQAQHFRLVFEVARRAGWLDGVEVHHVGYGTVMRPDGKPFKTREGASVRLADLLDGAVSAADKALSERTEGLDVDERHRQAALVGIGALKYADLSVTRVKNYVFAPEAMVSLQGDTGVYLQYAHARTCSVLAQAPDFDVDRGEVVLRSTGMLDAAERDLALRLDGFAAALLATNDELAPSELAGYLSRLARTFTGFYENCPILKASSAEQRRNRLLLTALTQKTLQKGLELLGIDAPRSLGAPRREA